MKFEFYQQWIYFIEYNNCLMEVMSFFYWSLQSLHFLIITGKCVVIAKWRKSNTHNLKKNWL